MYAVAVQGVVPSASAVHILPATPRGPSSNNESGPLMVQRLASDSIGTTTVTLTNVVVGSRYRIEIAGTGALAEPTANAEGVAASSTVDITLNLYAAGNANNSLRIKVRKATPGSTAYKPFETQLTLSATAQSAFVGQIEDE